MKRTAIVVALLALLLTASFAMLPIAQASTVTECYCYNQGDTIGGPTSGNNQYVELNLWITNKGGYDGGSGYDLHMIFDPSNTSSFLYYPPARYGPDIDTYWYSWAENDIIQGVWEVKSLRHGASANSNQTGSFNQALSLAGTQYMTPSWLSDVPDPAVQSQAGTSFTISWTAQTDYVDANFADPSPDSTTDGLVDYEVFGNDGGGWTSWGMMDTAYSAGGTMTFSGTLTGGTTFKVAPVYKYVNYDGSSATYTSDCWSDAGLYLEPSVPPVTCGASTGQYNLMALPRDVEAASWTANGWALDLEGDGFTVLEIISYDGQWHSYIHREGSDPGAGIVNIDDFALANDASYFVGIYSGADPGSWDCELSGQYSAGVQLAINGGWNAISLPWSTLATADDLLGENVNFEAVYHFPGTWEGRWADSSGDLFDLQSNPGESNYAASENGNGLFLLSTAYGTTINWTPT